MEGKRVISPNEYGERLNFAQTVLSDLLEMEIPGGMKGTAGAVGGTYITDPVVPLVEEAFYTIGHARAAFRKLMGERRSKDDEDES